MRKENRIRILCGLLALLFFVWFVFFMERDGARYVEKDGTFRPGETWQVREGFAMTLLGAETDCTAVPALVTNGEKWKPDQIITLTFRFENRSGRPMAGYEAAALFGGDAICARPYPVEEKNSFAPGEAGTFTVAFAAAADASATHVNVQHRVEGQMHWATFMTA